MLQLFFIACFRKVTQFLQTTRASLTKGWYIGVAFVTWQLLFCLILCWIDAFTVGMPSPESNRAASFVLLCVAVFSGLSLWLVWHDFIFKKWWPFHVPLWLYPLLITMLILGIGIRLCFPPPHSWVYWVCPLFYLPVFWECIRSCSSIYFGIHQWAKSWIQAPQRLILTQCSAAEIKQTQPKSAPPQELPF